MLTDNLKLKLYPAIIGVMGVCLTALLFSRFEVQVLTEPAPPEQSAANSESFERSPVASPVSPAAAPSVAPTPASPSVPDTSQKPEASSAQNLRVSNQTEYPVRVALLSQKPGTVEEGAVDSENRSYEQPVHWDFAPGEGKSKGLKLSLPDGTLQLQTGDVLMAFAQDGSRRYWGPYVVGKTALPTWNLTAQEWLLNLQP
ncbi:MAG: hypothetical protein KME15_19535 [Drouetiella hepatica Uher 2000/2452]|jgi:hypothetical protein|uniref:Uncharacterized protein n=1 Tax=Drouetiella hepatica Uher 2000/2452 TaxID=904376 RepID=A0A951QDL8_9CYAN|nr:hypothetical protein [Drouetiella hepatica Uher 2000/2452]